MTEPKPKPRRRGRKFLIILSIILVILSVGGIYVYKNFNSLLSRALLASFNNSIASDVYELKFEDLKLNFVTRSIRVINVELYPKGLHSNDYPYINSSFKLKTGELNLENVDLRTLLRDKKLILDKIEIVKPEVELELHGERYFFMPFVERDTTARKQKKNPIESFQLDQFRLVDASIHVMNYQKEREFFISGFNISLDDLLMSQKPGMDEFDFSQINLTIEDFRGDLKKNAFRNINFSDYSITIDSVDVNSSLDTLEYHFADFNSGIKNLEIQSKDSLFSMSLQSFLMSYKDSTIQLDSIAIHPNVSDQEIQDRFKYQHTNFACDIGQLKMVKVNFDSLIYSGSINVEELIIDRLDASVYADKTKPIDPEKYPDYLAQQIQKIPIPLTVKKVSVTNAHLVNTEIRNTGTKAVANIHRANVTVDNLTNRSSSKPLVIKANAYIEDKAPVNVTLTFHYDRQEYQFNVKTGKFQLKDLNKLIVAYTPASITAGVADEITFSGTAYKTGSSGTMQFLYHDLQMDLNLKNQADWKNSVLSFAANTYLNESNPFLEGEPARVVDFKMERDMQKGFINVLIKSMLGGLKETMIMSKENRKEFKKEKKEERRKNKK